MKNYAIFFSLGALIAATACNNSSQEIYTPTTITLSEKQSVTASQIIDSYYYIPLGITSRPIGTIDQLIVNNDNIIVVDKDMAKGVFIFDRKGTLQAEICAAGRGPKEYAELNHVSITHVDGHTVLAILDARVRKVLLYSLDGEFIESHILPFRIEGMEYLSNDNVLCFAADYASKDNFFDGRDDAGKLLYLTDSNFGIKASIMPDRTPNRDIAYTSPYVKCHGEHITIVPPLGDTIYTIKGQELFPEYRVDLSQLAGNRPATENMTDNQIIDAIERIPMLLPDGIVDGKDFIFLPVTSPHDKGVKTFIYDKNSSSTYMLENEGSKTSDEARLAKMAIMGIKAVCGNEYISYVPAYVIPMMYPDKTDNPLLPNSVDENSNPVIIFYTFKSSDA